MSYSAWLTAVARKELTVRAGLEAVAEFEHEHGTITDDELADAEDWARQAIARGRRSGVGYSRTA